MRWERSLSAIRRRLCIDPVKLPCPCPGYPNHSLSHRICRVWLLNSLSSDVKRRSPLHAMHWSALPVPRKEPTFARSRLITKFSFLMPLPVDTLISVKVGFRLAARRFPPPRSFAQHATTIRRRCLYDCCHSGQDSLRLWIIDAISRPSCDFRSMSSRMFSSTTNSGPSFFCN
jgi:hypothetical protein